ncbi:3-phosphoshikimate 1-carboxyvinyltransferase [Chondrinema litorale]|uniref:3-phosphoshikimate 1-carboxyvinyltransferase n=1 Tax=Chondrinema litorale TaxID=2994555 RepID=UPI002543E2F3|nr:3-phosphoshikimate 1-carboxyvinyltransferase [Chondrinema litorale]UZR92734.1 3-phosphoshikimate 1-carboxyvinyltransferase [Chondrinema litorale]
MTNHSITLSHSGEKINAQIPLTASKSECNRALIIQALAGDKITLDNISEARDSQTMKRLLQSNELELDVLDAGTTMRFLTAYCVANNRETVLTGTARMQERPIKILVDALRILGAEIEYKKNEGYPPIYIKSFEQKNKEVNIAGNVSSQYISALLMIAPKLLLGISLNLEGEVTSKPYILMTLQLLEHFGIKYTWQGANISIEPQSYQSNHYSIESDWSGASYWYSIVALAKDAEIKLLGLRNNSLQGDKAIVEIMSQLGVSSTFDEEGVILRKTTPIKEFNFDFTHCPDLAQTIAVICAAKGIKAKMTGLESLRIKETDRIAAIQNELAKINVEVVVDGDKGIEIIPNNLKVEGVVFDTYEDHRMAMAFAPLSLLGNIGIEEPDVVNKSYPPYWKHLKLAGFEITE